MSTLPGSHPRAGEFAKKAAHHNLAPEELGHLHNVGRGGLLRKVTPEPMAENLMKRGLIVKRTGGYVATDEGHMVLYGSDLTTMAGV